MVMKMKEQILKILRETDDFISGEAMCEILGITRSAIWKHIKTLKEEGYEIESSTKKGYKLKSAPDTLSFAELSPYLKTKLLGNKIVYLDTVDSTNNYGKIIALEGAPDGTVIVSEEQTLGRGRLERNWVSPKHKGIWTSIILRPSLEPIMAGRLTQIAAAALHLAIKKQNIISQIKWPNDIVVNGKKVAGVLIELNCELSEIKYVVVGVGINVNLDKEDFFSELQHKATSLKIESGQSINRKQLLGDFLNYFEELYDEFIETENMPTTLQLCKDNSAVLGKEIRIINREKEENGVALDIAPDGNLVVKYNDGKIKKVFSGEVSVRGLNGYI